MDMFLMDARTFALPLFIMAVGGIYSERSGISALTLEGFQGFGAFFGALTVILWNHIAGESPYSIWGAMLMAMAGGMLISALHALLCIRFKADHIISGVIVNILAVALTSFFTSEINRMITGKALNKFQLNPAKRYDLPILSQLPLIGGLFKNVYIFELVILAVVIISWYVMYRTRFGLRMRACGENPHAVDAAGCNVYKLRLAGVLVSGAFSGLGGIAFTYSISACFSSSIYMGYGFLALSAMIFGNWKIVQTLFACLVFGVARSGSYVLCQKAGLSSNFTDLFLILPYVVTLFLLMFLSKYNRPPLAAGEIYERGKR